MPLRAIFSEGHVRAVLDDAAGTADLEILERRFATFLAAVASATDVAGDPDAVAAVGAGRLTRAFAEPSLDGRPGLGATGRRYLSGWHSRGWANSRHRRTSGRRAARGTKSCGSAGAIASGLHDAGLDEAEGWAVADLVRVLLTLPRPSEMGGPARTVDARLLAQWLESDPVRTAIGLNTWEGVEYVDRDRFSATLRWAVRLDAIDALPEPPVEAKPGSAATSRTKADLVERLSSAAEAADYRVDRLLEALAPPAAKRATRPKEPRP